MVIFATLLGTLGCHGTGEEVCTEAVCATSCPHCNAAPECAPPKAPLREKPTPTIRETHTEDRAAIAQDIMLVPRTVYVPYAPQTPVRPVRLGSLAPGLRRQVTREVTGVRDAPAARDAEEQPPAAMSKEQAKQLLRALQCLDGIAERIDRLEARTASICPPEAGSVDPRYCPPSFDGTEMLPMPRERVK